MRATPGERHAGHSLGVSSRSAISLQAMRHRAAPPPGRPRGCPLGLPQIRTCPIKAYGSSRHGFTPGFAIRSRSGDRLPRLGVPDLSPDCGSVTRPPFPPPGPRLASSPTSAVLWKAPTPAAPSHRTLVRARRYPLASGLSLPPPPDAAVACQEFRVRHPSGQRNQRGRTAGLSGCWGIRVSVRRVLGPRQDPDARPLRHPGTVPPRVQAVDSLREACLRGSIARPSPGLSTLRPRGRPHRRKTRFRLPARLYRVGLVTHRIPMTGFRDACSFPNLSGRKNDKAQRPAHAEKDVYARWPKSRGGSAEAAGSSKCPF
jgi:hypothetical protein